LLPLRRCELKEFAFVSASQLILEFEDLNIRTIQFFFKIEFWVRKVETLKVSCLARKKNKECENDKPNLNNVGRAGSVVPK
jgi:hypothetical protein